MEWFILLAIVAMYYSLSEQIKNLTRNQVNEKKKEFPSLNGLIEKNIEIEIYNDYGNEGVIGILKEYDDKWLVLESINKKNKKELNYYRLANTSAINIISKI